VIKPMTERNARGKVQYENLPCPKRDPADKRQQLI